jgi:hypothetical protein
MACLLAGVLLLSGCGKPKAPAAELQTGYFDIGTLTALEPVEEDAAANYDMADVNTKRPIETFFCYQSEDGADYRFDNAGRLRRYNSNKTTGSASADSLKTEEELHELCDKVLTSYIPDYAEYTEITSQYYEGDSGTYNLAMEHKIAEGIADYALIRLDDAGEVFDLSITYANADGDSAGNFLTEEDRAYFDEQAEPFLTALEGYPGEVSYMQYKKIGGKLYAFYEFSYTDKGTGLTAGEKLLVFQK